MSKRSSNDEKPVSRRKWLGIALTGIAVGGVGMTVLREGKVETTSAGAVEPTPAPTIPVVDAKGTEITVYASPSCGCCKVWMSQMTDNGFKLNTVYENDVSETKKKYKVPEKLQSCHTGIVGGYVVEGHVPPDLIVKMLAEKPNILGLAVPGMPMGAPGMEQGGKPQSYSVMSFDAKGNTAVYAER